MLGVGVEDSFAVSMYRVAHILGKHFRSGEWGNLHRCGSVVTCVMGGRSMYARVERFLRVDGDDAEGYASVTWFGEPEYPFDIPLVVKCRERQPQSFVAPDGCAYPSARMTPLPATLTHQIQITRWLITPRG